MTTPDHDPATEEDDEPQPLVCVKSARLVKSGSAVRFAPCFPRTRSQPYEAVAGAVCEAGRLHAAPGANCRCGFHGVRTRADLWRLEPAREAVLLDVELAGMVVEHEFGVRARHQAVLGVHLPSICTKWRCHRTTAGVAPYRSTAYEADLSACTPLRPVCQRCGKRRFISVAELASALGVEVSVDTDDDAETVDTPAPALEPLTRASVSSRLGGALSSSLWFYAPMPANPGNTRAHPASRAVWGIWIGVALVALTVLVVLATLSSR